MQPLLAIAATAFRATTLLTHTFADVILKDATVIF